MSGLEIDVLADFASLEALRDEWGDLCDRCPRATPFQRPEWLIPWNREFPPWEPWILTARREGRLIGLLPLFLYNNQDRGERTLAFFGAGLSDVHELLADPGEEREVAAAFFACLDERRAAWDACDLEQLRPGSPLLETPAPPGWTDEVGRQDVCPVLELPSTVEALDEVLPSRQRYNLRQFRRRAEREHGLRLEAVGEDGLDPAMDELERRVRARWGEESLQASFQRRAAAAFLESGRLALYVLRLGDRIAAVHYGFHEKGTLFCYLHGFDPAFEKLSPGVLLLGGVIEDAVRSGAREIDFLRGRETYKYRWGARDRENRRRRLGPSSLTRWSG
ncbi:MAG TPA: GNAT family N-acetyltransferase [Thermoanaerobaculia bacterium]|nr:GNAT family N-acetyltransferase [Thermoanaerobaculia bacterium]